MGDCEWETTSSFGTASAVRSCITCALPVLASTRGCRNATHFFRFSLSSQPEVQARLEAALDACGTQGVGWGECGLDFNKRQSYNHTCALARAGGGEHDSLRTPSLARLQRVFALLVPLVRADELEAAPELRQQMRQALVVKVCQSWRAGVL